jgi:glycosyltransferase involved in cell wall biosynthesis
MNILIANASHYQSGGDWTYIDTITKIYESHGHKVIHFAKKDERNFKSEFEDFFVEKIDYQDVNSKKSPSNIIKVLSRSIYSTEAQVKLNDLLDIYNVDVAQLNNINNAQTPSIIKTLEDRNIPIVWRILDYKLICANRTLLSKGSICYACKNKGFHNIVIKKCVHDSYLASLVGMMESSFYSMSKYYEKVNLFSFQSEFTRDKFVEFGFDKSKTTIIENPIFSECEPNFRNKNYILYFGRISYEKGINDLLKSMLLLEDVNLVIVGDGPEMSQSKEFVLNNNLSNNVSFTGPKWGSELDNYIRNCKFVIIPSIWNDPNPLVVLQSYLFGKPVIGSDIGGISDQIDHNSTGYLFPAGNITLLAESIKELYSDDNLIIKMGKNAEIKAKTIYSPDRYYKKTMKIFTKLVSDKN